MQKVIIADDHEVVREGLRHLIVSTLNDVDVILADSAEQVLLKCREIQPKLVILDISMPGMGGIETIRRLRSKQPKQNILIFSIYKNFQLAKKALGLGALGYVTKSCGTKQLLEGINMTLNGQSYISRDVMENEQNLQDENALSVLTARQLDIFKKIASGMSTSDVSKVLFLSDKTVANNVSLIKKKLNVSTAAEFVHIALNEGLIPAADTDRVHSGGDH